MEERELDNLILNGETKVLIGSYTINGNVIIQNSELIVFGNLAIGDNVMLENSEVIVSGELLIAGYSKISSIATDISVGSLYISDFDVWGTVFSIEDSDIFVAGDFDSCIEISSNSDITVSGNFSGIDVSCLNFFVQGSIHCRDINAILDIYCLSSINAFDLSARDIFSDDSIDCIRLEYWGSVYWANKLSCCHSGGSVGK